MDLEKLHITFKVKQQFSPHDELLSIGTSNGRPLQLHHMVMPPSPCLHGHLYVKHTSWCVPGDRITCQHSGPLTKQHLSYNIAFCVNFIFIPSLGAVQCRSVASKLYSEKTASSVHIRHVFQSFVNWFQVSQIHKGKDDYRATGKLHFVCQSSAWVFIPWAVIC